MIIEPIATITTPFGEKFAIPRQAQIVTEAWGTLRFSQPYRHKDSLDGLEAHSHYWLIWGFHRHQDKEKSLTVRPPRLGGNRRVGVFSTRSPFRPNNLALSVVKLEHIDREQFCVTFSGVDMLSGSPVYDIKPYAPYADRRIEAASDWADCPPEPVFSVKLLPEVGGTLRDYEKTHGVRLIALIKALLVYDARPAYKKGEDNKCYATRLYDMDIAWRIKGDTVTVISAKQS
ncbi:MAG: tRNA (N6-threonylcarbamoyladenosine(37)-N6)-methyltransferase TrmO [Gammaproteobacteria bacterium]|nr:MAG: tRNA (N6-threonylcarbamoyladenosine(37)-N6)-methyltransferase TrmO [Gammaproteobacteria bacterium]